MSKPSSRKHLLGQQAAKPVSRRLSVRIPVLLNAMVEEGYRKDEISRNKWLSDTVVRFRQRQVMDRLKLPPRPDDDKEESAEQEPDAALKNWHTEEVNRALALLVKETFITTTGGVTLPIRFTDEGLHAMQDMMSRIDSVRTLKPENLSDGTKFERAVDLSHLTNTRTVLVHAALWDRFMEGRDIQDVSRLMASMDDPETAQLEFPDLVETREAASGSR